MILLLAPQLTPHRKASSAAQLGTSRIAVYDRALLPAAFLPADCQPATRTCSSLVYQAKLWLVPMGHCIELSTSREVITEVLASAGGDLPAAGLVMELLCAGDKTATHHGEHGAVRYQVDVRTEGLHSEHFDALVADLLATEQSDEVLVVEAELNGTAQRVSMLEISRLSQELRISSVHTDQSRLEVIRASTVVTLLG